MMTRSVSKNLLLLVVVVIPLLAACGDDGAGDGGGDDVGGDDAPGETCEMDSECPSSAMLCFGVGVASSCQGGGLCVGDPSGLACAAPCDSDADCAKQGAASVCLLDCAEPLLNGRCTTPEQDGELLQFPFCTTPSEPRRGIAGST